MDDEPRSSLTPEQKAFRTGGKGLLGVAIAIPLLALMGLIFYCSSEENTGSLELSGGPGSPWTLNVATAECESGDGHRPRYFGLTLTSTRPGEEVKLLGNEPMETISTFIITIPGRDPITVSADSCSRLESHIDWTGSRVGTNSRTGVDTIDANATVDCTLPDGTHLTGTFTVDNCGR